MSDLSSKLTRILRRVLRRDRHVLTRVPGGGPVIYAERLRRGARAGDRLILKERR